MDRRIVCPKTPFGFQACLLKNLENTYTGQCSVGREGSHACKRRHTQNNYILLWKTLPTGHIIQHRRPNVLVAIFTARPTPRAARILRFGRHSRPDSNQLKGSLDHIQGELQQYEMVEAGRVRGRGIGIRYPKRKLQKHGSPGSGEVKQDVDLFGSKRCALLLRSYVDSSQEKQKAKKYASLGL
jgi:hypothetical protein